MALTPRGRAASHRARGSSGRRVRRAIDRAVVYLKHVELTKAKHFQPEPGHEGATVWGLLMGLSGLVPQVLQPDVLGRATYAVLAGVLERPLGGAGFRGVGVALGDHFVARAAGVKSATRQAFRHVKAKTGGRVGTQVGSGQDDALQEATLSAQALVRKPRGARRWKRRLLERRGATIFYRGLREGATGGGAKHAEPTSWIRRFKLEGVERVRLSEGDAAVVELVERTQAVGGGTNARELTEVRLLGGGDGTEAVQEARLWAAAFREAAAATKVHKGGALAVGSPGAAATAALLTTARRWIGGDTGDLGDGDAASV